jgi:hypothetical protein
MFEYLDTKVTNYANKCIPEGIRFERFATAEMGMILYLSVWRLEMDMVV